MNFGRSADGVSLAIVLLVPLFLFRDAVFGGGVLYERDIHLLWHAQIEGFVRSVAGGSWPSWDPWIGFGQPLLANPNTQVYYPPTWLNLLMRPWTYYTGFAAAHLAWAGLGAHILARVVGVSTPGARVAAVVWMASGPLLSLATMWNHFAGAAWMPWVLAATKRLGDQPNVRHAVILGLAVAAQFLAGSPDMSLYTGLAAAVAIVTATVRLAGTTGDRLRLIGLAVGAVTVAVGLSAAQWMPTLDLIHGSARASLSPEMRTYWSVHPLGALEMLIPGIWRTLLLSDAGRTAFSESREPFLIGTYLGLPTVGLVLAAFIAPARRWALLASLGLGAFLIALGRNAPFYEGLVTAIPLLRLSRFPVKAVPLMAMAWAVLAGLGWDAWRDAATGRRRAWLVVATSVLVLAGCSVLAIRLVPWLAPALFEGSSRGFPGYLVASALTAGIGAAAYGRALRPLRAAPLSLVVAGLASLDLLAYHRNANPTAPVALYTHRPPVVAALAGPVRVFVRVPQDHLAAEREGSAGLLRIPEGWRIGSAMAMGQQMSLDSLTAARWGIRGSFSVDYMGFHPIFLARLAAMVAIAERTPPYEPLLRLAGVTHVVTRDARPLGNLHQIAVHEGLLQSPVRVLAVRAPIPRVLVVGSSWQTGDATALLDPSFDPTREVLLPNGPEVAHPEGFDALIESVVDRPDAVSARVRLSHPGFLVVLDAWAPGWRARIDGTDAPVLRANHAFRAVALPPGHHDVEMEYRPLSVRAGMWVSVATALFLAAGALWRRGARATD